MTSTKMLAVSLFFHDYGVHGQWHACNGEIQFEPASQLSKAVHQKLLRWGFVDVDDSYIYRPR